MPDNVDIKGAATVRRYVNDEISQCEQDFHRLTRQLSVDRDYVESAEADPAEIDYFRLQVELQQLQLEFLNKRLTILKRWQRQ